METSAKEEPAALHLLSRGAAHRSYAHPGENLDFEVSLLCTDDPYVARTRSDTPTVPYDSERIARLFYSARDAHDVPASDTGNDAIDIKVFCAQVFGVCLADSTWVNDVSTYSERFSYPREEKKEGEGWLWGWLGGGGDENVSGVAWEEGALPTPVVSKLQTNYQNVLESSPVEILPRETRLGCGSMQTFSLRMTLPPELPPSYHGYAMKYVYHVWCCAVWSHKGVVRHHVLRLPFLLVNPAASLRPIRPAPLPSRFDHDWRCRRTANTFKCTASHESALSCFTRAGDAARDDGLAMLQECVPGEANEDTEDRPHHYHRDSYEAIEQLLALPRLHETPIVHDGVTFLKLTTLGMHCCTGGSVSGLLSSVENDKFSCVRVSVKLEYEEQVPDALFKKGTFVPTPQRQFPKSGDSLSEEFADLKVSQKRTVDELDEVMLDCDESSFSFVISPSFPPTLYTDKVAVEWYLSFEFHFIQNQHRDDYLSSGRIVCDNVILWQLPLQIHAALSEQKAQSKPQAYTFAS